MTGGLRQEFYQRMARDYELEGERSFLYRYFAQNPPKRRGGERRRDIRRDIQTFLYDTQHDRKIDRSLAMFAAYCEGLGIDPFLGGGASVPDPDEVDAFYHTLRRGDNEEIFLPVYIDPVTGAGLYIIGTNFLGELASGVSGVCCYGLLYPNNLGLMEEGGSYTWELWFGDRREAADCLNIPSAEEGLCWLRRTVTAKALEWFVSGNRACPPGCPAALRRYFSPADSEDLEEKATSEDLKEQVAYGERRYVEDEEDS